METLTKNEYGPFYQTYIDALQGYEGDIPMILEQSYDKALALFRSIPQEKYDYAYAEGKWTIKELIQHLIDTERIMAYRALRFGRNDTTALAGFEENHYVQFCNANERDFSELVAEFTTVRKSTLYLYQSFSVEALTRIGNAFNNHLSVRALGYIISGHLVHHLYVLESRYLK